MCIFFTHAQLSFFLYTTITYVVTEKEVVCQEKRMNLTTICDSGKKK